MIIFTIAGRIVAGPNDVIKILGNLKPVMRIVIIVGNWILFIDVLTNYCFALIRGHRLFEALNKPQIVVLDNNTKNANRIIGSFLVKHFIVYLYTKNRFKILIKI